MPGFIGVTALRITSPSKWRLGPGMILGCLPSFGATVVKELEDQDTWPLTLYDTERRDFVKELAGGSHCRSIRQAEGHVGLAFGFLELTPPGEPSAGPTGRESPAQGRGRRPTPWEKGTPSLRPGGAARRPRDLARLVLLVRTKALSDVVGHLKKSSNDGLRNRGSQMPGQRSRDPSGRTGLSISPPRASASGLGPGLRSPGPLGRQSLRTAQGNSDDILATILHLKPPSRNPSVQLRAIRTDWSNPMGQTALPSQSLHTAQGNSDTDPRPACARSGSEKSQSLRTAQGNSDIVCLLDLCRRVIVAIPPYSSGQFGPKRLRASMLSLQGRSQSLRTAQGNSDASWPLPGAFCEPRSQSLHTAQGNSDSLTLRFYPVSC
jgi:hypothetical protein